MITEITIQMISEQLLMHYGRSGRLRKRLGGFLSCCLHIPPVAHGALLKPMRARGYWHVFDRRHVT
jgi:hypothetical protein